MPPLYTLKKIENLWYDDADVVFCARKSKFRVHRGILSAQSTIFRDMFSLPQDKEEMEQSQNDSFTVITLPDNDEDLYYFFLAIFDASFYASPPSKVPLYVTISILQLAYKYDVPFLLQRAIVHLDLSFPPERERLLEISLSDGNEGYYDDVDTYCSHMLETLFNLLRIADSVGIQWIIPSVIFAITLRYGFSYIMEISSLAPLDALTQYMVIQCHINSAAEEVWSNTWLGILPSENCFDHEACGYMSRKIQGDNLNLDSATTARSSCFTKMTLPSGQAFCRNCQVVGTEHQRKVTQKFWNKYPTVCGFASWDDVIQTRDKAMAALNDGLVKFKSIKFVAR